MQTLFIILILVLSVVIHEVAHGSVANSLGDPTAKYAGRLTLNPLKHLDPFGSVILPLLLVMTKAPVVIGWAKPVPINPYNFTDQKYGRLKVSLAGPAANLLLALIFGIASRFVPLAMEVKSEVVASIFYSGQMMVGFWEQIFFFFLAITFVNILLGLFNLIPIPPLDGSHILFTFFPSLEIKMTRAYAKIGFLGTILLLFLLWNLFPFLIQAVYSLFRLVVGV